MKPWIEAVASFGSELYEEDGFSFNFFIATALMSVSGGTKSASFVCERGCRRRKGAVPVLDVLTRFPELHSVICRRFWHLLMDVFS